MVVGERSLRICDWTWGRVVVMGASASAVMPDHLRNINN